MSSRAAWRLFVFGLVAALFVCLILTTLFLPTGVSWDPANGILAAMQYEASISPDIRTRVMPNRGNLLRDLTRRLTWWPSSYQAIPFALRSMNMPWGNALRGTIVACLLLGTVGWAFYFRLYVPNWELAGLVLLIMLCSSYISEFAESYYGGDLLLWTATPFLMVTNLAALRVERLRTGLLLAFSGGCLSATIYWLKYAGLFLGLGLGAAWAWFACFERSQRSKFAAWLGGFVCGGILLKIGGTFGGATLASAGKPSDLYAALFATGMWPIAMTDLEDLMVAGMNSVGLSYEMKTETAALTGWLILGALFALAAVRRSYLRQRSQIEAKEACVEVQRGRTLLLIVIAVDTALYASVVGLGGVVSIYPRLARMSGLLALPVMFSLVGGCVCIPHRLIRPIAVILMTALFILPSQRSLYKSVKRLSALLGQRDKLVNDQGIRPDIRALDVRNLIQEVRSHVVSKETVLYTSSPSNLLCFPEQRGIFFETVGQPLNEVRRQQFSGLPAKGVALLLPKSHAAPSNGKLEAIKASFTDVTAWDSIDLRYAPDWILVMSRTP